MTLKLFGDFVRTSEVPFYTFDSDYDCLNLSNIPEIVAVREKLEEYFKAYPKKDQQEFWNDFTHKNDVKHRSALLELYWFGSLVEHGYDVIVHPTIEGRNSKPDFLVRQGQEDVFILESKCIFDSEEEMKIWKKTLMVIKYLEDMFENILQNIQVDVEIDVISWGSIEIKKTCVVDFFEILLCTDAGRDYRDIFFREEGWEICFNVRNHTQYRGSILPKTRTWWGNHPKKILKAIKKKANKYGPLHVPYILAMDSLSYPTSALNVAEAVHEHWGHIDKPKNKNLGLSAILWITGMVSFNMMNSNPVVYHNPGAIKKLNSELHLSWLQHKFIKPDMETC